MQLYLSVTPDQAATANASAFTLAHVAYRIGPGSTLLRQNLLLQTRGGLLSISDLDAPPIDDAKALCAAVLRECGRRGYNGAVLDFEQPVRHDRLIFAQQLSTQLQSSRRTLFVPAAYGKAVPQAIPLFCTAISGGDLSQRLREAAAANQGRRLALDVQRLRMDFALPARSGEGRPLTAPELQELMEQRAPSVFFSPALCTRYFTYTQNHVAHFVLFDDAETLRQKIRIGSSLGFCAAFFQWPEVQDILPQLRNLL